MSDDFKTSLENLEQALCDSLECYYYLADHCPEPVTVDNDFLCSHVSTVIQFLHCEHYIVLERLLGG